MATDETKRSVETDEINSIKKRKADIEELEVNLEAPEPPSKRARRAEKKGKKLPPKPDSDDEKASNKKQEKEDAKASATRSEHAVWVGNLPWSVTTDELRKWLIEHSGEAITEESITRVNMPTQKQPGKNVKVNKGFAYVDFADMGPKVAAIALSENWLGIRKLLIKDATSFEGRPKKEERDAKDAAANGPGAKSADVPASRKIFVGNLSFQTTEDDVRANFEKCGEIDWVKIATFEDSGKCKGYGWVKFREAESAGWAVKGFVKLKEEIETEDDFVSKPDEGSGDDNEAESEQKKFKTRKWWVNRIAGRTLKIELAEDDQARYKKRFGKDAQRRKMQSQNDGESAPPDSNKSNAKPPSPPRELKAQDDLMVARLTGTAAKHTGTKITFN